MTTPGTASPKAASKKARPATQSPQWRVQALSVPSPDSDLALYVAFDNVRYLFGVGEGVQRTFVQRKVGLKGVEGVFVLGGDGEGKHVGGLAGVFMTAADAGIKHLSVCGPPSITTQIAAMRSFVMRDALAVTTHTSDEAASHEKAEPIYSTSALKVKTITLRPTLEPAPKAPASPRLNSSIDWSSQTFRPKRLSPHRRRQWETMIINDMLRGVRPEEQATSFVASKPVSVPEAGPSNPTGRYNPARPNHRAVLPLVQKHVQDSQLVYICEGPPVRGKFDAVKAKELGVPNGPLRGKLTGGQTIEFDFKIKGEDGSETVEKRVVRPEDCLGAGEDGAIFVLASVPDERYLPGLLSSGAWAPYRLEEGADVPEQKIQLMVHRCSRAVLENAEWQAWLAGFGSSTHHLIAQTDHYSNRATFNSACWNMLSMSLLNEDIFSIPHACNDATAPKPALPPSCTLLEPYHNVGMYPASATTLLPARPSDAPFPTTLEGIEEAKAKVRESMAEYATAVDVAREAVAKKVKQRMEVEAGVGEDIVVTTLGTGSAIPSKYRNVSSTHLAIPGFGGVIFDAGEGTLGQLRRKFGAEGVKKVYEDLRVLVISHMHADHHIGLAAVLEDRFKLGVQSELVLIAPSYIKLHLQESHAWQNAAGANVDKLIFVDVARIRGAHTSPSRSESDSGVETDASGNAQPWGRKGVRTAKALEKLRAWGLVEVQTPEVQHRGKAYGCVLRHESGWKVVYSGDTMPCDNLVAAGKDATLLIHEATLEDDKPEMAQAKGHSTFGQAINVGHRMNARHTLLNHFSQRYPKLPRLQPSSTPAANLAVAPVVSLSFDLMSIRVGDMWKMAHYKDAISLLFPAEDEADGEMSETDEPAAVITKNPAQPAGRPGSKNQMKKEKTRQRQQQAREAKLAELENGKKHSAEPAEERASKRVKATPGEIRV